MPAATVLGPDVELPPGTHLVYVPATILLGMVLGFLLGRRSVEGDDGRPALYDEDLDDY